MKRYACAIVGVFALTAGSAAQQYPDPKQQPDPKTSQKSEQAQKEQGRTVTLEGCLTRESDVPGRSSAAAGTGQGYVLTQAKTVKGTAASGGTQAQSGTEGTAGTTGARSAMYKVQGISDDKLKDHVGHRIQIDGMVERGDRAGAQKSEAQKTESPTSAAGKDELVTIKATTMRHIAAECTPKQ